MKRISCLAIFLIAAVPGWCAAKKITIAELRSMLQAMHKDNKSDADVALALKQVVMSEQLMRPVMNSLAGDVPGQETTEQLYVLEARSAMLPPASDDLPPTPPPDVAAQQALLSKASAFAANYQKLPSMSVVRTTRRFQDNVEVVSNSSGMAGSAKDAPSNAVDPLHFVRYINSTDSHIVLDQGIERLPLDKTRWGSNRMIQIMEPEPSLTEVFNEATAAGEIKWARWEVIEGKPAAVFAFQVSRKKAHLPVNICCFPEVDQTGTTATQASALGRASSDPVRGMSGDFQTNTNWHPYKQSNLPYHGKFFIDPDSGVVLRMITEMEPKRSDVVHQEDTRTDYAAIELGGNRFVLPVRSWVITEVVPNGDSGAAIFSTRCTMFSSDYKDYQLAH